MQLAESISNDTRMLQDLRVRYHQRLESIDEAIKPLLEACLKVGQVVSRIPGSDGVIPEQKTFDSIEEVRTFLERKKNDVAVDYEHYKHQLILRFSESYATWSKLTEERDEIRHNLEGIDRNLISLDKENERRRGSFKYEGNSSPLNGSPSHWTASIREESDARHFSDAILAKVRDTVQNHQTKVWKHALHPDNHNHPNNAAAGTVASPKTPLSTQFMAMQANELSRSLTLLVEESVGSQSAIFHHMQQQQRELQRVSSREQQLSSQVTALEGQVQESEAEQNALREQLRDALRGSSEASAQVLSLRQELQHVQAKVISLMPLESLCENQRARLEASRQEMQKLRRGLEEKEGSEGRLRTECEEQTQRISALQQAMSALEQRHASEKSDWESESTAREQVQWKEREKKWQKSAGKWEKEAETLKVKVQSLLQAQETGRAQHALMQEEVDRYRAAALRSQEDTRRLNEELERKEKRLEELAAQLEQSLTLQHRLSQLEDVANQRKQISTSALPTALSTGTPPATVSSAIAPKAAPKAAASSSESSLALLLRERQQLRAALQGTSSTSALKVTPTAAVGPVPTPEATKPDHTLTMNETTAVANPNPDSVDAAATATATVKENEHEDGNEKVRTGAESITASPALVPAETQEFLALEAVSAVDAHLEEQLQSPVTTDNGRLLGRSLEVLQEQQREIEEVLSRSSTLAALPPPFRLEPPAGDESPRSSLSLREEHKGESAEKEEDDDDDEKGQEKEKKEEEESDTFQALMALLDQEGQELRQQIRVSDSQNTVLQSDIEGVKSLLLEMQQKGNERVAIIRRMSSDAL